MNQLREKIYQIIFGVDTPAGKGFDIILLILILSSITILMLETVQELNKWAPTFIALDWIITGLFTIEYFLRIWTSRRRMQYVFSIYGLIDLFSILPTYISLFISGSHTFAIIRALRLLRVFRVLKLVRFMGEASKLKVALKTSSPKILVFLFFVTIVSVFVGTLMYMIEGPENGFTNIPRSVYWAIVTLTTVGYGDIAPQTTLGQFLSMILMITGYGVIAVPTGLVTAEMVKENTIVSDTASLAIKKCDHCGNREHRENAKFCSECGHELLIR